MKRYDYIPSLNEMLEEGFGIQFESTIEKNRFKLTVPEDHISGATHVILMPDRLAWFKEYCNQTGQFSSIRHNNIGPALLNKIGQHYYVDGNRHRYDGPAYIEFTSNIKTWWLHGKQIYHQDYVIWLDNMGIDMYNLSPEDKVLIDMKWGQ